MQRNEGERMSNDVLNNLMGPRVRQGQYGNIPVIIRLQIWSDEKWKILINTIPSPQCHRVSLGMECSPVQGSAVSWYPFHNMRPPPHPPRYPGVFVAIYLGIIEHRHTLTDWLLSSFSSPLSYSLSLSLSKLQTENRGNLTTHHIVNYHQGPSPKLLSMLYHYPVHRTAEREKERER